MTPSAPCARTFISRENTAIVTKNALNISVLPPRYTQQELLRVFLRNDFYAFVQKVFETVVPGVAFSRNWSTEAVAHALNRVVRGETTRLIINIPPRNLKSICASVALPAYLLGHDPTRKIIAVSYSDDLAAKFANDCRAVMQADWYKQTFPGTHIDKAKNTESESRTTERGYRLATSVGGTLTGRGGDIIIIDDPIKPQDAQSKSVRDKIIQWYENTLLSRLDDKVRGAIVIVMQRLREPLSALGKQRDGMTPLVFSAQYQQRPIPLEGNIIKREWLRYFNGDLPRQDGDFFVLSWDTAMKSSELADYSVGTVWHGTVGPRGSASCHTAHSHGSRPPSPSRPAAHVNYCRLRRVIYQRAGFGRRPPSRPKM
jgi:hypothetical protein